MTKSALVKIGIPSEQAQGVRFSRSVKTLLDQHEAAIARLDAAFRERLRALTTDDNAADSDEPPAATATA